MTTTPEPEIYLEQPLNELGAEITDTQKRIRALEIKLEAKIDAMENHIVGVIEKRDKRTWHAVYEMAQNVTAVLKRLIS